jgi:hypothetical protein
MRREIKYAIGKRGYEYRQRIHVLPLWFDQMLPSFVFIRFFDYRFETYSLSDASSINTQSSG